MTEAEIISLAQAHVFFYLHCLCMTTMTPLQLQRGCVQPLFCKEFFPELQQT